MVYYTGIMWEELWHAVKGSLSIIPFLFLAYLLIELVEEKIVDKYKTKKILASPLAPVVSAGFGLVPQCGFSVVATDLFSHKFLSLGSLLAVYIATSDEAIPILLSQPDRYVDLLLIIGIKFVFAVLVGIIVDLIFKKYKPVVQDDAIFSNIEGCCGHDVEENSTEQKSNWKHWLLHPIIHSLKVFAYILVINIIFALLIVWVGEDSIINFMMSTGVFQPIIVSLVGLIPNCASSVIITELYLLGGLSFGSCIAGLCVNSGIAIMVLFRLNKNLKQNFAILGALYFLSTALGIIINLF